jgi:hypothetical protein
MAARGVGRERPINESGIEQTVIAFDVTLKMPTSQQGTAAFPFGRALPWGAGMFEETPQASGLAAAFSSGRTWAGSVSQRSFRIFLPRGFPWEATGERAFYCRPPHGNTFNQGSALRRGGSLEPRSRDPYRRRVRFSFPSPALGERCHRVAHGGISLAYVPRRKAKPLELRHGYALAER